MNKFNRIRAGLGPIDSLVVHFGKESATFSVGENESILESLIETLFIWWELSPVDAQWYYSRVYNRTQGFTVGYHGCDLCTVHLAADGDFYVIPLKEV